MLHIFIAGILGVEKIKKRKKGKKREKAPKGAGKRRKNILVAIQNNIDNMMMTRLSASAFLVMK